MSKTASLELLPQNQTLPPWCESLRTKLHWENGRPVLPASAIPSEEEARWIAKRTETVLGWLSPGPDNRSQSARVIARLFVTLASDKLPDDLAAVRADTYLEALGDEPAWALDEAARRWIKGQELLPDENPAFVPKPAQLLRLAKAVKATYWQEAADLKAIAKAERQAGSAKCDAEMAARIDDMIAKAFDGKVTGVHKPAPPSEDAA